MSKFRKKPVVIEAVQYQLTLESRAEVSDFLVAANVAFTIPASQGMAEHIPLQISTLEGWMDANPGDWIIKGVKGECYPCKPDIFAATYESAE